MLATSGDGADAVPRTCDSWDNLWVEKYAHALDGYEEEALDKIGLIRRLDMRAFGLGSSGFGQVVVVGEESVVDHGEGADVRRYCHDDEFASNYLPLFRELVASEKSFADEGEFIRLHRTLFAGREGAGCYNEEPGGVFIYADDKMIGQVYKACPVADKPRELRRAFEAYEHACAQQPKLAIAYLGLLSVHINCIHPFYDGNGRTIRVLVASELRNRGLAAASEIPLAQVARKATLVNLINEVRSRECETKPCFSPDEKPSPDEPRTHQPLKMPEHPLTYADFTDLGRHALCYLDVLIRAYQLLLRR